MKPETFQFIRSFVQRHSAIVLDESKRYLVETRLQPVLYAQKMACMNELADHLRSDPHSTLAASVIDAMTTNETSFFRDRLPFAALRETILPELLSNIADHSRINIWSAACSSGQEPFSIAMLLREHFSNQPATRFHIVASDVSEEMLARARAGRFNEVEVNRGLAPELKRRYFRQEGSDWFIEKSLIEQVSISQGESH